MKTLPVPESVIQRGILELLGYYKIPAWRINTMGVPKRVVGGKIVFRPSPNRGVADILGILPGGRFLAIECKRPGGVATDEQKEFLETIRASGGLSLVADSIDFVEQTLRMNGYLKKKGGDTT